MIHGKSLCCAPETNGSKKNAGLFKGCCTTSPSIQNKSSSVSAQNVFEARIVFRYPPTRNHRKVEVPHERSPVSLSVNFKNVPQPSQSSATSQADALQSKQPRARKHADLQRPPPASPEVIRIEVLSYSKI